MLRILLHAILLILPLLLAAQEGSLTDEFAGLSARERTRIARREADEAPRDAAFQAIMAQGEELFRQQRYEDALERYREARRLRPYNVYPPVKIQDLQALLARRDAERAANVAIDRPEVVPPEAVPTAVPSHVQAPLEQHPVGPTGLVERGISPRTTGLSAAPVPVAPVAPGPRPSAVPRTPTPEGHERTFREGRAIVLERWRSENGRSVEYRRVTHPWGEVMYFRDGRPEPSRTWEEAFPDHVGTSRTGNSSSER